LLKRQRVAWRRRKRRLISSPQTSYLLSVKFRPGVQRAPMPSPLPPIRVAWAPCVRFDYLTKYLLSLEVAVWSRLLSLGKRADEAANCVCTSKKSARLTRTGVKQAAPFWRLSAALLCRRPLPYDVGMTVPAYFAGCPANALRIVGTTRRRCPQACRGKGVRGRVSSRPRSMRHAPFADSFAR
jgi:hypothetical protein